MTDEMQQWWMHEASVETAGGLTANGQSFGASTPIECFVVAQHRLVLDQDGREVVSGTTLFAPREHAAKLAVGSRLTYDEYTGTVIARFIYDAGQLGAMPECVEVALT